MCHYSFLNEHFFELWLRSKKKEYMAEGAKLIGAGCATIALAGAGAGIGIVFGSFKGFRFIQGLPVRGQRSHTNARSCRKKKIV